MKNTLLDLNNHLFAEIERLSDEDLRGEDLSEELSRARELGRIAGRIIENGKLALDAVKFSDDHMSMDTHVPRMLTGGGRDAGKDAVDN